MVGFSFTNGKTLNTAATVWLIVKLADILKEVLVETY
jgi:hypothetical protein